MCGIAGILARGGRDQGADVVPRIWAAMERRGPDDFGYMRLRDGAVRRSRDWNPADATSELLLAHRRLSILDLSEAGWQPMQSGDGRFHLAFNGEIYNFVELGRELEGEGHRFASSSDTEVLLAALQTWGTDALPRLIGMFAFALADVHERTLLVARDFFGIKPLLYATPPDTFAFASELRALLAVPGISRRADPQQIYRYLRFGDTDRGERTLLSEVHHLPAAHFLRVPFDRPHELRIERYWDIDLHQRLDVSFDEAADRVREEFLHSVKLHLRSDVPVGSCLSGGIDSSAVVMCMREVQPTDLDLHTFSFISSDARLSEERWVDIVGEAARSTVHKTSPSGGTLVDDVTGLIDDQGEPFATTSIFAGRSVCRLASERGIKVLLDGQGADEMLAGYRILLSARFASLVNQGKVVDALRFARQAGAHNGVRASTLMMRSGLYLLPRALQPIARRLVGRPLVMPWHRPEILTHDLRSLAGLNRPPPRSLRAALYRRLTEDLGQLLRYEDRNTMAFSIEGRVPFLTPALVQLHFSLPEEHLLSMQGETKSVFRRAMRSIVPDPILDRRDKIGFVSPELDWLRDQRAWVHDTLTSDVAGRLPMTDGKRLLACFEDMAAGRAPYENEVWRTLNLVEWARAYGIEFS